MTDPSVIPDAGYDHADVMRRFEIERRQLADLRDTNKGVLFDALERALITTVRVTFDGGGDSGQIETIEADDREGRQLRLPDETVSYLHRGYGDDPVREEPQTVREAVEAMVYACLGEAHPGWENNDGADGDFTFDVATRTITLAHNQRFLDITSYEHAF